MKVLETYDGDISDYRGNCPVLVTDLYMSREAYDTLKCELFSRGVDLVSTHWLDDDVVIRLIRGDLERRKKRGGRQRFGFYKKNGIIVENPAMVAVARKVIELRDDGLTYREIRENEDVRFADGRKLAISTLQAIVSNREKYERK
jgi:hypothetical protein